MLSLDKWADIATVAGVPVAVIALAYTARSLRSSALTSRAQFWLEIEKMFAVHDAVHVKLRPGGAWADEVSGPEAADEWAAVEDYMGLFEHCELLLRQKLIDWETFSRLFSYRVSNILYHRDIVRAKLIEEGSSWGLFIDLCVRLEHNNSLWWRFSSRLTRQQLPSSIESARVAIAHRN